MRRYVELSNGLAVSSAFPSWLDCTINTCGYDFRKRLRFTGKILCSSSVRPVVCSCICAICNSSSAAAAPQRRHRSYRRWRSKRLMLDQPMIFVVAGSAREMSLAKSQAKRLKLFLIAACAKRHGRIAPLYGFFSKDLWRSQAHRSSSFPTNPIRYLFDAVLGDAHGRAVR